MKIINGHQVCGWIVWLERIDEAALYPVCQELEALGAARRWNACVAALVMHPDAPTFSHHGYEGCPLVGCTKPMPHDHDISGPSKNSGEPGN